MPDDTKSTITSAADAVAAGDAHAPDAATTPVADTSSLAGVKVFVASMAKIGRVITDEGGAQVDVRLSPDANDPTAPVVTVSRADCVRNAAL